MTTKLIWRVMAAPTGPYRSFQRRDWPMATHEKGGSAAYILGGDVSYAPALARAERLDFDLSVFVAVREPGVSGFAWRRLKARARSLAEAKQLAQDYFDRQTNPRT